VAEVLGIKIGTLICTEAMFNERARAYGKQKASLIVIPRASGTDIDSWKIAGAMASLVSGAYVVSSNRVSSNHVSSNRAGRSKNGTQFGGGGFAFAPVRLGPQGRLLSETSFASPVQTFELDPKIVASAQSEYPCYVPELG
jgi:N-carbamoylputrescine amidase